MPTWPASMSGQDPAPDPGQSGRPPHARKVREGRWAEAEQLIAKTIAQEIPNTARIALTDPLLFMIRAEQNRLGEHFDQVKAMAAQSTSWEHWPTWRMGYYLAMTQCGRGDEVLERVDRFNQADVEAIETRNITFLILRARLDGRL